MTASPYGHGSQNNLFGLKNMSSYTHDELHRLDVASLVEGPLSASTMSKAKPAAVQSGDTPPRSARGKHLRVLALLNSAYRKGMNRAQSVPMLSTLETFEPGPFGACGTATLLPEANLQGGDCQHQKMAGIETQFRRAVGLRSEPMEPQLQQLQGAAPVLPTVAAPTPAPVVGEAGWGSGYKRGRGVGDVDVWDVEVKKHRGWAELSNSNRSHSHKSFFLGNWEQHYGGETHMEDVPQQGGHMDTCLMEAAVPQFHALSQSMVT